MSLLIPEHRPVVGSAAENPITRRWPYALPRPCDGSWRHYILMPVMYLMRRSQQPPSSLPAPSMEASPHGSHVRHLHSVRSFKRRIKPSALPWMFLSCLITSSAHLTMKTFTAFFTLAAATLTVASPAVRSTLAINTPYGSPIMDPAGVLTCRAARARPSASRRCCRGQAVSRRIS
jgi:hypothetical protein